MTTYIILPHIQIHNANALSSFYTIGFPAMTAWLGAVHGLQRKVQAYNAAFSEFRCLKTAVICHDCKLQVYKGYKNILIGTANPLKKKGSSYERPPFIAEGRVHLEVSLLIEASYIEPEYKEQCENALQQIVTAMKMASGDVIRMGRAEVLFADTADDKERRQILRRLMPGYVLIERRDLLQEQQASGTDALTALLQHLAVHCTAERDDNGKVIKWKYEKKTSGWIVPIAIGFKSLSALDRVEKQRDPSALHRFAECVVTLGEFKMAYRIQDIEDMMWQYTYDENQGMYLCKNQHEP